MTIGFKLLGNVLAEILLQPAYIITLLLNPLFSLSSTASRPTQRRPIVIIPGWFTSNLIFALLKFRLERLGFRVYVPGLGLLLHDLKQDTIRLKAYFDSQDLHHVVLVGASAGGLVSLDYLQNHNGWGRVDKFVSVAAPFRGIPPARATQFFSGSAKQMVPGSTYLQAINFPAISHQDKIVCLAAAHDQIVPRSSSFIPGAKREILPCAGHAYLQAVCPEVCARIARHSSIN